MELLLRISKLIDALNDRVGRAVYWLVLVAFALFDPLSSPKRQPCIKNEGERMPTRKSPAILPFALTAIVSNISNN